MKKFLVPCTCGCAIVAVIEFDPFEDDPQMYFAEFYTATRPGASRWERFKAAWRVVRGNDPWMHSVCWDANAVKELRDFLDSCIPND